MFIFVRQTLWHLHSPQWYMSHNWHLTRLLSCLSDGWVETEWREQGLQCVSVIPPSSGGAQRYWWWHTEKSSYFPSQWPFPSTQLLPQKEWHGMYKEFEFIWLTYDSFCYKMLFEDFSGACAVLTLTLKLFQVMMRAGQPLPGTNGRRCKEDEKLINATLRPGKRGYIIDTRSINVAQQAKARGGGFESEANYPQWRRINKTIERWAISACIDKLHIHLYVLFMNSADISFNIATHLLFVGLMSSRRAWLSWWRRVTTSHTAWTAG